MQTPLLSPRVPIDVEFYHEGSEKEALRLDRMALIANSVSLDMIMRLAQGGAPEGRIVADIGAGDSPRLGMELSGAGYTYRPVDMRYDAVEVQRRAGFEAVQSIATELSLESHSVDSVHARFTWGWLSDAERLLSLAEMVRIGREHVSLSIIDYDWSTIEGPELLRDMVADLVATMRQAGFEPAYGATVAEDLTDKLEYLVSGPHDIMTTRTSTYEGPIEAGIDQFIEPTVDAIMAQLEKIGRHEQVETLRRNLLTLREYALAHPGEQVRLPDIVAAGVAVDHLTERLTPAMVTYLDARGGGDLERRDYDSFTEEIDFLRALPDIVSARRVAIATSDEMILAARRIQTTAYYKNEIIGFDAVGDNGVLVDGNDPMELVRRSVYFIPMDEETSWMDGVVRIITPEEGLGVWSLPTVQRIASHSPQAAEVLKRYPFMQGNDKAVEVSGLAKNMLGGSLEDVMVAMVVLAEFSVRNGYRYGVMGLQESKVELIEHLFGKDAVRRIDGEDVVHHIDLPGVKEEALFVPLYVDGTTFIADVHRHASQRRGKLFATLTQLTAEILATYDSI